MATLLVILGVLIAVGLLIVRFGVDSRHTDPRDLRPNLR
jgi:hypothetical protein